LSHAQLLLLLRCLQQLLDEAFAIASFLRPLLLLLLILMRSVTGSKLLPLLLLLLQMQLQAEWRPQKCQCSMLLLGS
jgi:hypothetical protein